VQKCVSMETIAVQESRTFVTDDIYLAAALIASRKKFITFFWKRGKANFEFNETRECQQMSQAYFNGDLLVPGRENADALKYLKGRISEAVRKQKTVNVAP
jgi:hypothetical protein